MKIGFWGNFGTGNFGNECTLSAILSNVRRYVPNAECVCISNDPSDTIERHHIESYPISLAQGESTVHLSRPVRWMNRLMSEGRDWVRVFRTMRQFDMLIMTGTGMIADANEGTLGAPYQMFKWVISATVARRPVKFVSVGVEVLTQYRQHFWLASSLRLAAYRSFRDHMSRERAAKLIRKAQHDEIFPDLAFSLPESIISSRHSVSSRLTNVVVGIYAVEGGQDQVRKYVSTIGTFILWLVERNYLVRIVIGDAQYDYAVRDSLRSWLTERAPQANVIDEDATSFEQLMVQLAEADLVVATRFHNVLLAAILGKPVISISHMDKNDELMRAMGLEKYCCQLNGAKPENIMSLFEDLVRNSEAIRQSIEERALEFRNLLDRQYGDLFQTQT